MLSWNPDFKDLLKLFYETQVECLIVGAHAVVFYTQPRYTKDIDLWVNPSPTNAQKVWKALLLFGAPLKKIKAEDFTRSDTIYQIGVAPNRIDIFTHIGPLHFFESWQHKQAAFYDQVPIWILGKEDLISAKQYAHRPMDLIDIDKLKKA